MQHDEQYKADSLSLGGAVAIGTGVMIGAGIFALTGQVAELAKGLFPVAFLAAAIVAGLSSYSYVKLANAYPSAGGIAKFLEKAYGKGLLTATYALMMYFSMVINESLVARTFGTYTLRLFDAKDEDWLVPALGVGLLLTAFLVNIAGNEWISRLSLVSAFVKIGGIAIFAGAGLWLSGFSFESVSAANDATTPSLLASVAIALLAFKGFTTITNSGSEITDPHRNVGRAIVLSIAICVVVYTAVSLAVAGNLSLGEIIQARDTALAEAARPAFGNAGLIFTVVLAVIATLSGIIASVFAVSRMLAMLTDMELVPHRHFGMPGRIQTHTLVYTVVLAGLLTVFFDLSRIASLRAIFYLIMDIAIHWGVLRHVREEVEARAWVVLTAIVLDLAILGGFLAVKLQADRVVLYAAGIGLAVIFFGERIFLSRTVDQ
ncbi:MAG: amino acid permease [Acidobacteria bacterium]|nr:amino acid permease [Acidobacteriota bacterium]